MNKPTEKTIRDVCRPIIDELAERFAELSGTADDYADYMRRIPDALTAALAVEAGAHQDDLAVDRFATAMKAKLAKKRAEGRGGWENKDDCSAEFLSHLLRDHVEKGDPVDVGNLAMMLQQRGERISALTPASSEVEGEAVAAIWVAKRDIQYVHKNEYIRVIAVEPAKTDKCDVPLYYHPAPTPAGEWRLVPQSAIDWLLGEGPDANGVHFGDDLKGGEPRYWWRAHFRKLLPASPAPHQEDLE